MSAPFPASIAQAGTLPFSQKMMAMTDYPSNALVKKYFQDKNKAQDEFEYRASILDLT
jgi:hypothetical protein